jgi:hypothetical protein
VKAAVLLGLCMGQSWPLTKHCCHCGVCDRHVSLSTSLEMRTSLSWSIT